MGHMIDISQVFIASAITIMTVVLVVVGINLIIFLRNMSKIIARVNGIVDELEKIGMHVGHGMGELVGFVSGIKGFFKIVDLLSKKKKNDKK